MTETEIKALVERVLAELADRAPVPPSEPTGPSALVVFSGALLGFEDALASLKRLRSSGMRLDYVQTDAAQHILDQDAIAAAGLTPASESLTKSHDLLIVATMTVNLAAKVAHGIGDCLASNLMAEFIMRGAPVIASVAGACPDSPEKKGWFPNMPPSYQAMLRSNLEVLRSFGVRLAGAGNLDRAALKAVGRSGPPECQEKVISEAVVRSFAPGSTVRISPKAVVTALAHDSARTLNITLTRG